MKTYEELTISAMAHAETVIPKNVRSDIGRDLLLKLAAQSYKAGYYQAQTEYIMEPAFTDLKGAIEDIINDEKSKSHGS